MGGAVSAEKKQSKLLEKQMKADNERESMKVKLLLLGAGESGKSTIFKQMKLLYGKQFSEEERISITPVVYSNVLTIMKILLGKVEEFGRLEDLSQEDQDAFKIINSLDDDATLTEEHEKPLKLLWASKVVQEVFDRRAEYQVVDSTSVFLKEENISRICAQDYVADQADVLATRIRTSGIIEEEYLIDGVTFAMYDVGGQRNERKKWIHCFEGVTAVLFIVGVSEYNQVLYEDTSTNRMIEALELFKDISNSPHFLESSMLLFLNKKDLFIEKIQSVGIKETFEPVFLKKYPDGQPYEGTPNSYGEGLQYFSNLFLGQCQVPKKLVYVHVTCATDTENVRVVFEACKETILQANLQNAGFAF